MNKMTRTEAADVMAIQVRCFARRTGQRLTLLMCEEIVSEFRGTVGEGRFLGDAARSANPKTVYRLATRYPL